MFEDDYEHIERYDLKAQDNDHQAVANAVPKIIETLKQSGIVAEGEQKSWLSSLLDRFKESVFKLGCSFKVLSRFNNRNATIVLGSNAPVRGTAIRNAHQIEQLKQNLLDGMEKEEYVAVSDAEVIPSDAVTQKGGPHFQPQPKRTIQDSLALSGLEIFKELALAGCRVCVDTSPDGKLRMMVTGGNATSPDTECKDCTIIDNRGGQINIAKKENNVMDVDNSFRARDIIQEGNGNSIGNTNTIQNGVSLDDFKKMLREFLDELKATDKTAFSADDAEDIRSKVSEIEKQLQSQSPKTGIMKASLELLKQYLVGVASSLSANYIARIDYINSLEIQ